MSLVIATSCGLSTANNSNTLSNSKVVQLGIAAETLSPATAETEYSASLVATGGVLPYSWQVSSGTLPSGLSLATDTGILSGTTDQIGIFIFQATVTDSQHSMVNASLSLLVLANTPPPLPLGIATQTLLSATAETAYSVSLVATGGVLPYSWRVSSGVLPSGLSLAISTGILSGTMDQPGTFPFQVTVTDSQQSVATASLSLSVMANTPPPLPLGIATQTLSSVTAETAYSVSLAATGGVPPYSWQVSSGALPSGFSLATNTGILSGTTNQTGNFSFQVTVTDSQGTEASALLSILVAVARDLDNLYCPDGLPLWGTSDGPATLPLSCMNTALWNTPSPGSVVSVTTAAQFTAALAPGTAACGQTIQLQAGNTFSGNFTISTLACPSTNWLTIETSGVASLPAEGARYATTYTGSGGIARTVYGPQFGPCYAGVTSLAGRPPLLCPTPAGTYTAKLITPNSTPVLKFSAGTSGVRLIGIEITRATGTGYVSPLVLSGNIGLSNIILDRVWCHGDENEDETGFCLSFSAASNMAVIDSYFNDFYCISSIGTCTDSYPILGGGNTLNSTTETGIKVVNNFLEAAGESTMLSGGGAANTTPADMEIRLNLAFKPLQWNPSDPSYNGGISGHALIVKNLFELKNAQRVLYEGNQLINTWAGFSQDGSAILLTPKSQASGSTSLCFTCFVSNITLRYNTINTVGAFGQFEADADDNGGLSSGGTGWSIHDMVIDNEGYATCYGGCGLGGVPIAEELNVGAGQTLSDVSFNHITLVFPTVLCSKCTTNKIHVLGISGPMLSTGLGLAGISYTNNVQQTGLGTTNLDGGGFTNNCAYNQPPGTPMMNACFVVPYTFAGNCLVDNGSISWPAGNVTSVASYLAVFTNYNNGDGGDYTIPSGSPCKAAGTDGLDPGANIGNVAAVIAGVPAPSTP